MSPGGTLKEPQGAFRFGPFSLDVRRRELLDQSGQVIDLEPKPLRILEMLLQQPGKVITLSEFRAELWPDVNVELGNNLNTQVNKVRRALGEDGQRPAFILTKRGQGYYLSPNVVVERLRAADDARELSGGLPVGDSAIEPSLPMPSRIDRRAIFRSIMVGAPLALAAVGAAVAFRNRLAPRVPASVRVSGRKLTALTENGDELWRYLLPAANKEPLPYEGTTPDQVAYLSDDVDGDGQTELVFHHLAAQQGVGSMLFCFDRDGRVKWEFTPGKLVRDRAHEYAPPYWTVSFTAVQARDHDRYKRIVVASVHGWGSGCQIAVLDGRTGKLVSEYWHRGHLLHIAVADLHRKGTRQVFLGGVNDAPERKQATLVMFDSQHIAGSSCDKGGQPHFVGMERGTEQAVIYFAKTELSQQEEFNRVREIRVHNDRVTAMVAEGVMPNAPYVVYELDREFHPINVLLSNELHNWYKRARPGFNPGRIATVLSEGLTATFPTGLQSSRV